MAPEKVLFFVIFFITFVYTNYIILDLFKNRNKVKETKATITNVELALSPGLPHINAKLATFEYLVNGKKYTSKNSIKMNLSAEVGDVKMINYFIDDPRLLYKMDMTYFYIASVTSLISLLIGLLI